VKDSLRDIKTGNNENNLKEVLQLLLQQYQDFVDRKERLENKALGYLTPLAMLFAASVAIMIMLMQEDAEIRGTFLIIAFTFFGQAYFSSWTFIFVLKAYSVKASDYPDIKKYSNENWAIQKTEFLGGINQTFEDAIDSVDNLLQKLIEDVQFCRLFLTISFVFGILTITIFIVHIFYYYIRIKL